MTPGSVKGSEEEGTNSEDSTAGINARRVVEPQIDIEARNLLHLFVGEIEVGVMQVLSESGLVV
jgi:hypothetical protein